MELVLNKYFYIGFAPLELIERGYGVPEKFKKKKDVFCIIFFGYLIVIGGIK